MRVDFNSGNEFFFRGTRKLMRATEAKNVLPFCGARTFLSAATSERQHGEICRERFPQRPLLRTGMSALRAKRAERFHFLE